MSAEIWIAVWFFGTIVLAIGAAVFEPMRKLFVIYIGALGVCLALPMARAVVIPACLIWTIVVFFRRRRTDECVYCGSVDLRGAASCICTRLAQKIPK